MTHHDHKTIEDEELEDEEFREYEEEELLKGEEVFEDNELLEEEVKEEVNKFDEILPDDIEIDPETGFKSKILDSDGCPKGTKWNSELGRCLPIED